MIATADRTGWIVLILALLCAYGGVRGSWKPPRIELGPTTMTYSVGGGSKVYVWRRCGEFRLWTATVPLQPWPFRRMRQSVTFDYQADAEGLATRGLGMLSEALGAANHGIPATIFGVSADELVQILNGYRDAAP